MQLPDNYTRLQYLQSSGTQYIDTGILFNPDFSYELEFSALNPPTNSDSAIFGCYNSTQRRFRLYNSSDNVWTLQLGTQSITLEHKPALNTKNSFVYKNHICKINDEIILSGESTQSTTNIYLFQSSATSPQWNTNQKVRIYSWKVYDSENHLIQDLIPCRSDSNILGFYDIISKTFLQNIGSGTFTPSPEFIAHDNRRLEVPQYDIEIWDWKTNTYVTDISNIVTDGLNISWLLNDIETLNFTIDLIQFEKKCSLMGVSPEQVLTPYVHDIRIRRNGKYILGVQVVETNFRLEDELRLIEIKCTGFLNLFKDQYISESWGGYTYAQIARKLVERGQHADCLIKNPTIDINSGYWLTDTGTISRVTTSTHGGSGKLQVTRSGTGWTTCGTKMDISAGISCKVDIWVSGQANVPINVVERSLINSSTDQQTIATVIPTSSDTWTHITATFTTRFTKGYLYIQQNRTDASYNLCVDDCYVYREDDDDTLNNLNVQLGIDTASLYQSSNRERNYSLQNIKDALMNLTTLENDNFDFEFLPDRTFNCYDFKGGYKDGIEIAYPQNAKSLTITRSASNLANKIIGIGSGIGDERLQVYTTNTASRSLYGTRESILTNNNVSIQQTLVEQCEGEIRDRKNPVNLPTVVVEDGSINPSNTQVGDVIVVRVIDDDYLATINGFYRIMQYDISINAENKEIVTLTLELQEQL